MIDTPVAVFVYNRPDLTELLMQQVARVRPSLLLVVADGPRNAADAVKVDEVRDVVRGETSWAPEVLWHASEQNLGCAQRIDTGLDWVFSRVPHAVILEDDTEVAPAFFGFAADALDRYQHDRRIGMVTARNVLIEYSPDGRAFAARQGTVGAWATWADRWRTYRSGYQPADLAARLTHDCIWWALQRHQLARGDNALADDEWATTWEIWCTAQRWWTLVPPRNLMVSHGFRPDAVHNTQRQDLRAHYPPVADEPAPVLPDGQSLAFDEDYADLATYLDFLVTSAQPRRWRVLAEASRGRDDLAPSMQLRLTPWRDRARSLAILDHVGKYLRSAHLEALRDALR